MSENPDIFPNNNGYACPQVQPSTSGASMNNQRSYYEQDETRSRMDSYIDANPAHQDIDYYGTSNHSSSRMHYQDISTYNVMYNSNEQSSSYGRSFPGSQDFGPLRDFGRPMDEAMLIQQYETYNPVQVGASLVDHRMSMQESTGDYYPNGLLTHQENSNMPYSYPLRETHEEYPLQDIFEADQAAPAYYPYSPVESGYVSSTTENSSRPTSMSPEAPTRVYRPAKRNGNPRHSPIRSGDSELLLDFLKKKLSEQETTCIGWLCPERSIFIIKNQEQLASLWDANKNRQSDDQKKFRDRLRKGLDYYATRGVQLRRIDKKRSEANPKYQFLI